MKILKCKRILNLHTEFLNIEISNLLLVRGILTFCTSEFLRCRVTATKGFSNKKSIKFFETDISRNHI